MERRRKQSETAGMIVLGLLSVLVAFFASSFREATLLMMISGLNVVGMYYGERYGRFVTIFCLLTSGMVLQRSQVKIVLFVLCALVSMSGLALLEQWDPVNSQRNANASRDFAIPPELLSILFGCSSSSSLRNPDRKWLSLALHGVLQHVAPLKVPQFDIGGKLPLFSTRSSKTLSVKEVREGIIGKESAQSANRPSAGSSAGAPVGTEQGTPKSSNGILGSIWNAFGSGGDGSESIDATARDTSHVGPTGGFTSVIDFSYVADENTKIEIEIPMELPLWGTMSVPVMVASPEIAGSMQLEFRHDVIANEDGSSLTKVLAIGIMFEPIKEIHIHGIYISMASQFQLIQYVPIVKNYMKQAVNSALIPDTRRVLLFDSAFSSLGSFQLGKDETWNINGLLQRAKNQANGEDVLSASPSISSASGTSNRASSSNDPLSNVAPLPLIPVLDLTRADSETLLRASSSSSPPPITFLSATEFDADVPPSLEPGEPRELTPQEAEKYPRLQL
jgi:hypothetical protein